MKKKLVMRLLKKRNFSLKSYGYSMNPIIHDGDIVSYRRTSFLRTKLCDLIMIKKFGKLLTHRVIFKQHNYLITKGDNNINADGKIYPKKIIARLYQVKRSGQTFNPEDIYLIQSTLYFQEIIRIKQEFEKEKIDFVLLKGLPIHLYYEKTHPRRIYLDCDILIHNQAAGKADRILLSFGYKKADSSLFKIPKGIKDKKVESAYYKNINGFNVVFDLHYKAVFMMTQLGKLEALYPQNLIDQLTIELLQNTKIVNIQGEKFPILSPNDQIIYLVLHFFHHNFRGAFRLELLHRIILKYSRSVNWALISTKIKTYRVQNFVYPVFILLKKLYKTSIPPLFLKSIQPSSLPLQYLSSVINHPLLVFDDELRIRAGINRFKNLFFLSPNAIFTKILVFINIQVLFLIFWLMKKRITFKK